MMPLKLPDAVSRASRKAGFHLRSLQPRSLPGLAPMFQTGVARLRLQGAWVTNLDALSLSETDEMLAMADRLCCQLPRGDVAFQGMAATASHSVGLASRQLMAHPAIFLWGLQHPWLNLAECYLRQPAAYLGCVLRREVPNQRQVGVRLWHQDGEDYKTIKVIVYLNDVADTGGPFEYIPRSLTPAYGQFRSVNNRIDNAAMAQVVEPERWRRCPGPRGTVIVADTASVFHHASVPNCDRYSLTFAYTTAAPKHRARCLQWCPYEETQVWTDIQARLSDRQTLALLGWRQGRYGLGQLL